jgi:hypothetical protein
MSRFDEIRAANPELGFGLYALTPKGDVTLEIYTPDEQTFSFAGPDLETVLMLAFPPDARVEPEQLPTPSIFD